LKVYFPLRKPAGPIDPDAGCPFPYPLPDPGHGAVIHSFPVWMLSVEGSIIGPGRGVGATSIGLTVETDPPDDGGGTGSVVFVTVLFDPSGEYTGIVDRVESIGM